MKVRGNLINLQRYSPNMTRPTNKLNVTVMYVENFCKENGLILTSSATPISFSLTCFLTPGNMTRKAMYSVANKTETATMETSPVTGVLFGNVYRVGPPSSRNASNHPLIVFVAEIKFKWAFNKLWTFKQILVIINYRNEWIIELIRRSIRVNITFIGDTNLKPPIKS